MLTGPAIVYEIKVGRIVIKPFDPACVNPNSYDLHLGNELLIYNEGTEFLGGLTVGRNNRTAEPIAIPEEGYTLRPGRIYLGTTVEWTESHAPWIPCISGKSSLGRLGLSVHATAGFGDVGFRGQWTLELSVIEPLVIQAGIRVCQIYFQRADGEIQEYAGRYQDQRGPRPAKFTRETT